MTYEEIVSYVKKKAAKLDVKKMDVAAVQVDVTGEGEGAFYVAVKDGGLEVEPYEYYDHDAKLVIDSEDLIKVVDGKVDILSVLNDGTAYVEGNSEKIAVFKAFAGKTAAKKTTEKKVEEVKAVEKEAPKKEAVKKEEPVKEAPKKAEPEKEAVKPAEKKTEEKKVEEKKAAAKPVAKKVEEKKAPAKKSKKK